MTMFRIRWRGVEEEVVPHEALTLRVGGVPTIELLIKRAVETRDPLAIESMPEYREYDQARTPDERKALRTTYAARYAYFKAITPPDFNRGGDIGTARHLVAVIMAHTGGKYEQSNDSWLLAEYVMRIGTMYSRFRGERDHRFLIRDRKQANVRGYNEGYAAGLKVGRERRRQGAQATFNKGVEEGLRRAKLERDTNR